MKNVYSTMFLCLMLAACNGNQSNSADSNADSVAIAANADANLAKDNSPKILKVERSENFIPVEGATDEDYEMQTNVTEYSYDEEGRVVQIKNTADDANSISTFDYSQPGKVIETYKYSDEEEPLTNTYYMDKDGYVTKVEGYLGTFTFKYKDGHLIESNSSDNDGAITCEWKDGNMVTVTHPFGDEYVEVTTYTYTDIPLEGNFEYVQNFNWCGLNHINKISKGFNSKNHIKRIVNDHPLEDEYVYEKDNEGNIKLVTMSRCGDNYSQNVEIKAVIGK